MSKLAIVNTKEYFYQQRQLTQNPLELCTGREICAFEVGRLNPQEDGCHLEIIDFQLTEMW